MARGRALRPLAASIAKVGLLHPIVVTPNNELIADGKAQASTRTCHCRADLDRQRWVRWARAKHEMQLCSYPKMLGFTKRLLKDVYLFLLMAFAVLFVIVGTEFILWQGSEQARLVPVSLELLTTPKALLCEERAATSACAQFIKAGWSYGGTWIMLITVALAATLLSFTFLKRMCKNFSTRAVVFSTASVFFVSVIALTKNPGKLYDLTGNGATDGALRRGVFDLVFSAFGMTTPLNISIGFASFASALAGVTTAAACFATVLDLPPTAGPDGEISSALLKARMAEISIRFYRLRILIAMGAVFLVLGVLTTSGYLTWPSSFVKNTDRGTFKNLTDGILLVVGTEYSLLLLLGFFLPAGVIFISARSLAIELGASSQKQVDECLAEIGLNFSFPSVLKDSLTVLSPFIVSAFTSVSKLLS